MLGSKGGAVPIVALECCSLLSPRSRRQYCVLSHPNPYALAESPFVAARHAGHPKKRSTFFGDPDSPLSHMYRLRKQRAEQSRTQPIVVRFAWREREMDWQAIGLHHRVNLARQAAS
jgi:hypothetical protein